MLFRSTPCKDLDWQVSSLEQVFTSCLPHLSTLEGLFIDSFGGWRSDWQDNIENTLWLELLLPFTTVKNLHISEGFARRIVPALQELVEDRRIEVLPALENVFLEGLEPSSGPVEKGIGQFVAMREVTGHSVAVTRTEKKELPPFPLPPLPSLIQPLQEGRRRLTPETNSPYLRDKLLGLKKTYLRLAAVANRYK